MRRTTNARLTASASAEILRTSAGRPASSDAEPLPLPTTVRTPGPPLRELGVSDRASAVADSMAAEVSWSAPHSRCPSRLPSSRWRGDEPEYPAGGGSARRPRVHAPLVQVLELNPDGETSSSGSSRGWGRATLVIAHCRRAVSPSAGWSRSMSERGRGRGRGPSSVAFEVADADRGRGREEWRDCVIAGRRAPSAAWRPHRTGGVLRSCGSTRAPDRRHRLAPSRACARSNRVG